MEDEENTLEMLAEIFTTASGDALLETVKAIAAAAGIKKLQGMPVEEFYHRKKEAIAEQLVADLADSQPARATALKAAWDQIRAESDAQQENEEG